MNPQFIYEEGETDALIAIMRIPTITSKTKDDATSTQDVVVTLRRAAATVGVPVRIRRLFLFFLFLSFSAWFDS